MPDNETSFIDVMRAIQDYKKCDGFDSDAYGRLCDVVLDHFSTTHSQAFHAGVAWADKRNSPMKATAPDSKGREWTAAARPVETWEATFTVTDGTTTIRIATTETYSNRPTPAELQRSLRRFTT